MTDKTHLEALRLANEFKLCNEYDSIPSITDIDKAEAELRRQHTRIAELEAELEAVGAGGVQALSAAPGVPLRAIETLMNQAMAQAVANGANSVSMPDEIVEVAHWLAYRASPPAEQQAAPKAAPGEPFQHRVQPWLLQCFGAEIAADTVERNHRFLEEALELVQSTGCTQSEAHQLVDYVFGRPVGEPAQEVGGVMVTLAALCLANGLDMHNAGEIELARIWTKVEAIRAKQAAKPKHSPLPQAAPQQEAQEPVAWRYNRLGSCVNPWFKEAGREADDLRVGRWDTIAGLYMKPSENHVDWTPLYAAPQPAPAHPACKSDMLVNGGALVLAIAVLRRAGKTEVADELAKTAQPAPAPLSDGVVQKTWALLDELEKLRSADRYDEDWDTLNKRDDELRAALGARGD